MTLVFTLAPIIYCCYLSCLSTISKWRCTVLMVSMFQIALIHNEQAYHNTCESAFVASVHYNQQLLFPFLFMFEIISNVSWWMECKVQDVLRNGEQSQRAMQITLLLQTILLPWSILFFAEWNDCHLDFFLIKALLLNSTFALEQVHDKLNKLGLDYKTKCILTCWYFRFITILLCYSILYTRSFGPIWVQASLVWLQWASI
jgi:hypothetical protein